MHHRTEEQALRGTDWPCYATQIVMVLDWLYQPPKTKLVARQIVFWLIFPLLYLVYSLIRGSIVDWYAYPFFNPTKVGGYGVVALYCLGILVTFFILSWLLMLLGNKLGKADVVAIPASR